MDQRISRMRSFLDRGAGDVSSHPPMGTIICSLVRFGSCSSPSATVVRKVIWLVLAIGGRKSEARGRGR